jgi:hypothetical protein
LFSAGRILPAKRAIFLPQAAEEFGELLRIGESVCRTPSLATTSLLFTGLLQFKSKRLGSLFFAFADQEHGPINCKPIRKIGRGREQPHRAWRRSHFGGGYFPILG